MVVLNCAFAGAQLGDISYLEILRVIQVHQIQADGTHQLSRCQAETSLALTIRAVAPSSPVVSLSLRE